jgi:hypothetical protein
MKVTTFVILQSQNLKNARLFKVNFLFRGTILIGGQLRRHNDTPFGRPNPGGRLMDSNQEVVMG